MGFPFRHYLTAPSEDEKNTNLAELFKTLGYIVHLLQDMAVPAHTRNDFFWGHTTKIGCPDVDGDGEPECEKWSQKYGNLFEGYVRDNLRIIESEIKADEKVKKSVPFEGEKRLTALWDTDSWAILDKESYPPATTDIEKTAELTMGLAEYSNANFFSYFTIFNNMEKYPYPNKDTIADKVLPDQISVEKYEQIAQDGKKDESLYIVPERKA